jgi:Mn-dependent DtxR family transcriptional regulator
MMGYATISEISRRWKVDRATARAALQRAGVPPCDFFASPRYSWDEVLRKIEAWPEPTLEQIDRNARLETAEALADRLGVTPQTVRNYGRAGRLHRIELIPRAVRYGAPFLAKNESEGKTDDLHQK